MVGNLGLSSDLQALAADPEMAALFIAEAREHLANIEALVLELEQAAGDRSLLDAVYRPFHTIKGNAYAIGATVVGALAHDVESLLDIVRADPSCLGSAEVDSILAKVDQLEAAIGKLADGLHPSQSDAPPETASPDDRPESRSIKVDTDRLDTLVDVAGELGILYSMIRESWPSAVAPEGPIARQIGKFGLLLSELQRLSLSLRMVSLDRTFHRMARAARDTSRACAKPITLSISGAATELDRRVIEQITDPLIHLIRNAIDHGIEAAAVRDALGKPATARLELRASHRDGQVLIEVADDGKGLDTAKIRKIAVARGLMPEGDSRAPQEIHRLIFQPGFSTADTITDVSGRGVGLDVVARNVEALGGRIDITTAPGHGTTFALKLPLTMAIVRGVLVVTGRERFIVPAHVLREAIRRVDCEVHTGPDTRRFATIRGVSMPFAELAQLLGQPTGGRPDGADVGVVLAIEVDGRRAAIAADDVHGVEEFVVKPLGSAGRGRGFSGGAVLGDGRVGLILDAVALFGFIDGVQQAAA